MTDPGGSGGRRYQRRATQLVVDEIFVSIQGESSFAGLPCTFVRLAGCNLRCRWCDTLRARETGGAAVPLESVLSSALASPPQLVEITGGEPLCQAGSLRLITELCDAGRTVLLETNGSMDLSEVDPRAHRIVDLKAPSSGECARNRYENIGLLSERDEIKFVLANRRDYEWMVEKIAEQRLTERGFGVLVSCVWGELDPRQLVAWVLEDRLRVRVQLQLHKHIWGPDTSGV